MGLVSKIFFGIFSFFLLGFLVFFTFFVKNNDEGIDFSYLPLDNGVYKASPDKGILSSTLESEKKNTDTQSLYFERITPLSEVFFSEGSEYKIEKGKGDQFSIFLVKGNFVLKLKDPSIKFAVYGDGFSFVPESVGEILVKIGTEKKHSIFSFSSLLNIKLTDADWKKEYTQMYLFPRMYTFIDTLRNVSVENADRVRLDSVFSFGYKDAQFFKKDDKTELNGTGAEDIFFLRSGFDKNFLKKYIQFSQKTSQDLFVKLQFLKSQQSFYSIPGIQMVEKYMSIFYNDAKKTAYLKNIILYDFTDLLKEKEFNSTLINKILLDIDNLKKLSEKDSEDIKKTFLTYLYLVSEDYKSPEVDVRLNYYSLNAQYIYGRNLSLKLKSYFLLDRLFSNFDFEVKTSFYKDLNIFIKQFFFDSDLDTNDLRNDLKDQKNRKLFDYFAFFLEKILFLNLSSAHDEDMGDVINVMSNFISLNELLYSEGDEKRKITGMIVNINLLESLEKYLLKTYFQEKRSEKNLLLKKNSKDVNPQHVKQLKMNYESIRNFFVENSKFLKADDYKDMEIKNNYEEIFKEYDEYFLALTDYGNYELNYDAINKTLIDTKTINEELKETLSDTKIRSYLAGFYEVDLGNTEIQIIDNKYYDVKNVTIHGKTFSFKIFPLNDNEIRDIYIDGEARKESYKLDFVQQTYEDNMAKGGTSEDQNKYDFRNFFLQAFFGISNHSTTHVEQDDTEEKDPCPGSKYTNALRTKILSPAKGEFINFKDFFEVKYHNVCISSENQNINITISGALLKLQSSDGRGEEEVDFGSSYYLTDKEHYFDNITLRILDRNLVSTGKQKTFKLLGNPIKIVGKVDIYDFERYLKEIQQQLKPISDLVGGIIDVLKINVIETSYNITTKRVTIKFDFKAKKAIITIASGKIQSFIYSGKNLIQTPQGTEEVVNIIKNIK